MKKNELRPYLRAGITAFIVILASILFFFLMFHMAKIMETVSMVNYVLRPIFMGLVFAFLLLPVHKYISQLLTKLFTGKKKQQKPHANLIIVISILLSLIFAFTMLYILLAMVIPQVYVSIVGLIESIPQFITTAQQWLTKFLKDNPDIQSVFLSSYNSAAISVEEWLNREIIPNLHSFSSTLNWIKESLLPNITGVISNVSSAVVAILMWAKDFLIAVIVSVYLLARKDTFAAQSKKIVYSIFTPRHGDLIIAETRSAYRIMSGFINGKLLDSLIIGIITLVGCNLFNFPYPALIATIIGVTNIVPVFGPFIGAVPSAFLILLVDPLQCLYFVIFVIILQQFDGNILGPKILGETTGLASFWVLFSIILFGGLFGFAGMVLGVPLFAIIYSVIRRLVRRGLKRRNLPLETSDYMGMTESMAEVKVCEDTQEEK